MEGREVSFSMNYGGLGVGA